MKRILIEKIKLLILLPSLLFGLTVAGNIPGKPEPVRSDDDDKPGIIKGIIFDNSTNQPMEYANVAVYSLSDSALVTGGITNHLGEFEINGMTYGEYFIEAKFIGFDKTRIADISLGRDNPHFNAGKIELAPAAHEIGGVEVVADKSAVEYKLDKKVVNVSQVINAAGGTAVDVLENTPSVQVDIEGNVTLRGSSNFTVLIDGRPSVLSGTDALRQIPASALENIEIITNPSAKYEPDGMAGIINLVMKKNVNPGISGIVNVSAGTGDKYRGDFSLNRRTNKYSFTFGADWRDETNYGEMISERESYFPDSTSLIDMAGSRNFIRGGHNIKSGIDLFVTEKTTLTLSGQLGKSKNNGKGIGNIRYYSYPQVEDIFSVSQDLNKNESDFYNGNFNFIHNFDKNGHKLEALFYYSNREGTNTEEKNEFVSDENYEQSNSILDKVQTLTSEKQDELRFNADYTLPFSENGKLEAGLQNRMEKEFTELDFNDYDEASNSWVTNGLYSSSTDFKRNIYAVYSTYSNKFGGINLMAGLRGELTNQKIINSNINSDHSVNRFDLFPTFHSSYSFKEDIELMASYSRRIDRPRGRELNPVPTYFNRYTIRLGNPDLKPEYTNSFDLGLMKRFGGSYLSLEAFHRITNNKINWVENLGNDGIYYMSSQNLNKDYSTGVELTGNVNITEWFLVNASLSGFKYRITGELNGESIDRESTNWNGRMNATFKVAADSRIQLSGFYRGPSATAQGESKAMFSTNISYRQEFMKKKLSATLSVQDVFGTGKFERESFADDFKSYFRFKREPQVMLLTLSYKINNFKQENRNSVDQGGRGPEMDMGGGGF